ncbi:MAG TPA: dephospho-CoA kinase, partial [Polyangia bacterium]
DFGEIVVVDAPEDERVRRVVARDGSTPEHVRARMAAQAPMSEKRRLATHVIDNDGDLERLSRQVDELLARIGAGAAR